MSNILPRWIWLYCKISSLFTLITRQQSMIRLISPASFCRLIRIWIDLFQHIQHFKALNCGIWSFHGLKAAYMRDHRRLPSLTTLKLPNVSITNSRKSLWRLVSGGLLPITRYMSGGKVRFGQTAIVKAPTNHVCFRLQSGSRCTLVHLSPELYMSHSNR